MIKVYIRNENEREKGNTVAQWIELPMFSTDLIKAIDDLTNNNQDKYAISDYEAPFYIASNENVYSLSHLVDYINKHSNIIKPKEIANHIENYELEEAFHKIKEIAYHLCSLGDNSSLELCEEYITEDYATELAKHELENYGLGRLQMFLGDVNFISESVYRIDEYGNLNSVSKEEIQDLYDEVIDKLKDFIKSK